jgi:predicted nucleotidyltransferase
MKTARTKSNIREVVEQVVDLVHPLRIILFGSASRGETGRHADLDFLIVVQNNEETGRVTDRLNTDVRRREFPCDFLVVQSSVLERNRRNPGLIYGDILDHGKVIYAAG